jgi:hypothetical protein
MQMQGGREAKEGKEKKSDRSPRRLQQEHPNIISSLLPDRCPDGISQPPPAVVAIIFTVLGPSQLESRVFPPARSYFVSARVARQPITPVPIRYQVPVWDPALALTAQSHIDASRRGAVISGHRCSASQEPNCRTVAQVAVTDLRCIPTDRPTRVSKPCRATTTSLAVTKPKSDPRISRRQQLDWAEHRKQRKQEKSWEK